MDTTSAYFLVGFIIAFVLHRVRIASIRTRTALLRGPPRKSWLLGHEEMLRSQKNVCELEQHWTQDYGTVFRIGGFYGHDTLLVSDGKALQHILTFEDRFHKGADEERFLQALFGPGLATVGRSVHQRQRRILNPAFATPQVRAFLETVQISGAKMVDRIKTALQGSNHDTAELLGVVDIVDWTSRIALDVLGIFTFRHDFGALDDRKESTSLLDAQRIAAHGASTDPSLTEILISSFSRVLPPWIASLLSGLPTSETRKLKLFQDATKSATAGILERASQDNETNAKDVVGLLVDSMRTSQDPSKKMSQKEVLAQMATIIGAGHHTTALTMAFLLYELARHPSDQERLRAEISDICAKKPNNESWNAKDYDDLPFLNAVIKETLRLYPIVHSLDRRASQDDVLPLSEAVTLSDGTSTTFVPVAKGQNIHISLRTYNRLPNVWGEDSDSWNPLRFITERSKQTNVGVYANLITFSAGPRSCIGWQFAVAELQVQTVLMVRHFELRTVVDIREVPSLLGVSPGVVGTDAEGLPLELHIIY